VQTERILRKVLIVVAFWLLLASYTLMKMWTHSLPGLFDLSSLLILSIPALVPGLVFALSTATRAMGKGKVILSWTLCWLGCTVAFQVLTVYLLLLIGENSQCFSENFICSALAELSVMTVVGSALHLTFLQFIQSDTAAQVIKVLLQGATVGMANWLWVRATLVDYRTIVPGDRNEVEFIFSLIVFGITFGISFSLAKRLLVIPAYIGLEE
jgi:hypothetical protein